VDSPRRLRRSPIFERHLGQKQAVETQWGMSGSSKDKEDGEGLIDGGR
jgi:hypothetical protein